MVRWVGVKARKATRKPTAMRKRTRRGFSWSLRTTLLGEFPPFPG
jgi:hypothetical protein